MVGARTVVTYDEAFENQAVKNGKRVNLYVTTNERSNAIDLASGAFGSLILATRQLRPCTNLNSEGDHVDLATGVFRHQMPRHGYRRRLSTWWRYLAS